MKQTPLMALLVVRTANRIGVPTIRAGIVTGRKAVSRKKNVPAEGKK